jgi:hypothetical protein
VVGGLKRSVNLRVGDRLFRVASSVPSASVNRE